MKALMAILAIFLVSCTAPRPETSSESEPSESEPSPTVFDPLVGTLDRAAGVEDTIFEADAERRRQIDEAQGL